MSSESQIRPRTSYFHSASAEPFSGKTILELQDEVAKQFPRRDALVFCESGVRISFRQYIDDTKQLACDLVKLGLKPGERVCLWMGDGYEWIVLNSAIIRAGLIALALPEFQSTDDIRFTLNHMECSALFVGFSQYDQYGILKQVLPDIESDTITLSNVPTLRNIVSFDEKCPLLGCSIVTSAAELRGNGGAAENVFLEYLKRKITADDTYMITLTSGSTGYPKPVVRTHRGTLENVYATKCHATSNDQKVIKILKSSPLASSTGSYEAMLLAWGATLVSPRQTEDFTGALEAIENEGCNFAIIFPSILFQIVNQKNIDNFDVSSMQRCWCVGNVFPKHSMLNIVKLFCPNVVITYGTRETLCISIGEVADTLDDRISGKSKVLGHCEVKVVDTYQGVVPVNTIGDIMVRGPYLFQCYYGDKEATDKVKAENGWYKTGDRGEMDENGRLFIFGRGDDMIIKGSQNVFPVTITNYLGDHPKLKDAQVVPVPDEKFLSEMCLCVVLKEGVICTEDELLGYLSGKLSPFHMPRYVLFFEKFPFVGMKVNRKVIIKEAISRLGLSK
ncbi:medium-chain acyl-CoA ligase ACSF2, mitochondrial-like [Saccoglossus kowalevskii]|uniref:Acyl-CoA synthetase family member 2, mitochondrial-like n=1 Tax=Saccoglossus kowalevskii TaxID=10224 RepID=A0ABM0GK67_SACKO|nr:PREDICTED: acyl-CoA synthetase family member 2, mitochondrial-like [Saccoglossus kowalevskii]